MPEVGVGHAHEDEGEEGGEEYGLACQQRPPPAGDEGPDVAPVEGEQGKGHGSDGRERRRYRRQREGEQPVAGEQPDDDAHEQNTEGLREEVAAIGQAAQEHECYRHGQQGHELDDEEP